MEATGKRDRKETVAVYTVDSPTKKEFVIEEGKGTKLGDIPNVEFALSKIKSDDELLKLVHRSMYRTPGKATVIKKNIRAFSGFPEGFDSTKTEDLFNRAFAATLNAVLDLFDLPRGVGEEGKKESKVARIMKFMEAPAASGKKDMKAAADAKREKAAEKRERLAAKKEKLAEKKEKAKAKKEREQAKKDKERAKKGGGNAKGGASAKALPDDAQAIKAELQAMAARQAKLLAKLEKAVEPASPKAKPARKAADAEAPPAKRAKETAAEGADAAAEEKQSKMPDDDALREAIAELLKDSDHESLSLKKMRADLEERLGVPLNEKKAKIKEIVEAIVA